MSGLLKVAVKAWRRHPIAMTLAFPVAAFFVWGSVVLMARDLAYMLAAL